MRPTTLRAGTAAGASAFALLLLAATPAAAGGPGGGGHTVSSTRDSVDAAPGDGRCADAAGACSLRAAVQEANAAGSGTIVLSARTYRLALAGTDDTAAAGDLDVTGRLVVEGRGATVDAAGLDRVFDVRPGASLTLRDVVVKGGAAVGAGASGGGVLNAGTLVVDRSTLTRNTATRAGGGIEAVAGSTTTVTRSTLSYNSTGDGPGNGGGLHLTGAGTVRIDRGTVTGNRAANEGGGLWNSEPGTTTVTRTTIRGNTAPVGPDVFQDGAGTGFTVDGRTVPGEA